MNNCSAIGCPVTTKFFMCGAHYRWLPKEIRAGLTHAKYKGLKCVEAIEYIAERENKEITSIQYTTLMEKYNGSNTSKDHSA